MRANQMPPKAVKLLFYQGFSLVFYFYILINLIEITYDLAFRTAKIHKVSITAFCCVTSNKFVRMVSLYIFFI